MTDKDLNELNDLSRRSIRDVLITRNNLMLEAVIAAYLDTCTPVEIADILERQAQDLREYG